MNQRGQAQFSPVQNALREIGAVYQSRRPIGHAPSFHRMFTGLILFVPLVNKVCRYFQRALFMSRICLPRHARGGSSKVRQELYIELVAQEPVNWCSKYRLDQCAIEKRQLKFQPVQVKVFKMACELASDR